MYLFFYNLSGMICISIFLPCLKQKIFKVFSLLLGKVLAEKILKNYGQMDFPGGPVFKIPCFHCREHGFDPWSEKFCLPCGVAKKKILERHLLLFSRVRLSAP